MCSISIMPYHKTSRQPFLVSEEKKYRAWERGKNPRNESVTLPALPVSEGKQNDPLREKARNFSEGVKVRVARKIVYPKMQLK